MTDSALPISPRRTLPDMQILLALVLRQPPCHPLPRQRHQVRDRHRVHPAGPIAARGRQPPAVRAEHGPIHRARRVPAGSAVPLPVRRAPAASTPSPSGRRWCVASRLPSGLNATPNVGPLWPCSANNCSPVPASHSFTVPSLLEIATRVPSGLNAIPLIRTPSFKVSSALPLQRVPHPRRPVAAPRRHPRSIGTEDHLLNGILYVPRALSAAHRCRCRRCPPFRRRSLPRGGCHPG